MNKNIVIIHYNTPELTSATIKSINKNTFGCNFIIFDNSDKNFFDINKLQLNDLNIKIYNNTQGKYVNFKDKLKIDPLRSHINHASSKHIWSVEYLYNILNEGFVLVDSDVLFKTNIDIFFDKTFIWCGLKEQQTPIRHFKIRLAPYLLWINIPMCKRYNIKFVKKYQNFKVDNKKEPYYDTTASFLESCELNNLRGKEINIYDYIIHFKGGSSGKKDYNEWLEKYKYLYE